VTASTLCTISAGGFLLIGLLSGVWKFVCIATSPDSRAPVYVDVAHRASLMYAFACAVLAQLTQHSAWSNMVNVAASAVVIAFFALAVLSYLVHGALRDTDNQLLRPHRLGARTVPRAVMLSLMAALIVGEVGGFTIIFTGYLVR
jgi:hypothetical protein